MKRPELAIVVLATALTVGMLLYPPYMTALTGSHMGYYFAPQLPPLVSAFGSLDTGRLLLQLAALWGIATGLLLALRKHTP